MEQLLTVECYMDVLSAICLSWSVEYAFEQTGGIFVCSPPGQFKTSMLEKLTDIPGVRGASDLTSRELNQLHEGIESKRIRAVVFYEFPKLYERRSETAANLLGHIRSLVDEGFSGISSEADGMKSRCTVLAAMPLKFLRRHTDEWRDSGMGRRILISKFRLKDPRIITEAIHTNNKIHFQAFSLVPVGGIKMTVTEKESRTLEGHLRDQIGDATTLILLKKIVSVLRWRNEKLRLKDNSMERVKEFALSLRQTGVDMVL